MSHGKTRTYFFGILVASAILLTTTEVALRLARPHHRWLAAMLYEPSLRTWYDDVGSTEDLLESSILGFSPLRERCGFVLNSKGFRTPEYATEKQQGSYRIVVLGDSFAFASACVPWTSFWPVRLQAGLTRELGVEVEVINLGIPGVGPRFELRLWELEGRSLDSDLVVLALFVGNDLSDDQYVEKEMAPFSTWTRLSVALRLARNAWRVQTLRSARAHVDPNTILLGTTYDKGGYLLPEAGDYYDPMRPDLSEDEHLRVEWNRMQLIRPAHRALMEERWLELEEVIARLDDEIRATGSRLLVMVIPDEYQVDIELLERTAEAFGEDPSQWPVDYPQETIRSLLDGLGIAYLDLLPALREASIDGPVYKLRNTHWNHRGNELAAQEMVEAILDGDMLPIESGVEDGRK